MQKHTYRFKMPTPILRVTRLSNGDRILTFSTNGKEEDATHLLMSEISSIGEVHESPASYSTAQQVRITRKGDVSFFGLWMKPTKKRKKGDESTILGDNRDQVIEFLEHLRQRILAEWLVS
jgi:hypothetical protein